MEIAYIDICKTNTTQDLSRSQIADQKGSGII